MEAKDLMIEDWVYDTILQGYTRVKMLTARGIQGDIHDNIWDEKTFEPIPLTLEILKKNGFKDGQFFAELYIQGWHVISDAHNLCMECERGWHMNIPCRCLHELQHALRLCGIEKEITI